MIYERPQMNGGVGPPPPRPRTFRRNCGDQVFVTSPTKVYIDTSAKCSYYSQNDERTRRPRDDLGDRVRLIDVLERTCRLDLRTVLQDGEFEIQDLIAFFECDSSDSGHLYESLEPAPTQTHPSHAPPPIPIEEDFDSFDSDSDTDDHDKSTYAPTTPSLPASRLPNPPTGGGQYTLTKIASAAQRKMRQIKRNLTKRYTVAMDGKPFTKSPSNPTNIYDTAKKKTPTPIYANCEKQDPVYTNINFKDTRLVQNKTEIPLAKVYGSLKEELKTVISDKRASCGDVPPPLPDKPPPEKPVTPTIPTNETIKKDSGTLSRKAYFSFKSRFRRATSLAVDINSEVPSALKITNSTFYLTDSMDGDSGFSNCDNGQPGSTETLSPESGPRRRDELKRLLPTLSRKDKSPRARTSWYAECGADTTPNTTPITTPNTSNTSWYAEAGLYQAGNISSSSGASSGSHPASPLPHSLFTHEPLYQFYNAAKVESVCRDTGDSDSDAYEAGSQRSAATSGSETPARPSAMALVAPRGPSRTLWCEVPEVVNSAVLSSLAPAQKRLQEAKFELLTSEASYLNSLNVLEANFIAHPAFRDPHVLPRHEWETLFATILPVRKCSQLLMTELEKCWQENILLQGICDIVRQHAELHFSVYVKYCENQALMVRALQRLQARPAFVAALKKLESHPSCQSLSLASFLLLPMQRVTRLPLLLDAVLKHLDAHDTEYHACARALVTLNNYVSQCNEGARNTERIEEMYRLCASIDFPAHIRSPPCLGPACSRRDRRPVRWLVRSGEMTQLIWKSDELKLTFGKKFHKVPLHLFLFNDLLVIAKKKGEDQYICVDHCPRSLLEVCSSEVGAGGAKHALLITLLENHEGRTLEMLMSCPSETEWSRWAEALQPPTATSEGEAVYAGWDCPQVCALYAYAPAQPDELPLAEGDVVNVTRKTSEGWYYGERTRDGESGWFPGAYTAEIASPHVRARNLRQRYRLLALSGTYRGHKKRNL
ncbi:ephexin-1-like isoform X2 [Spodoptera litura]|uniref:Ephexin-1-like isoform X2 n=1 Tax=Spodoptera litura TaxID=69820 RepID=A0A9J7IQA8_SPOLT|nr:ephexin-1-like isoform X2 [Spodoptera litura]